MAEAAINHIGYQKLVVGATSVGLTMPTGNERPKRALIRAEGVAGTNDVRWRADGTDPTATDGILLPAGSVLDLTDPMGAYQGMIGRMEFIRVGAADGTIHVAFFT